MVIHRVIKEKVFAFIRHAAELSRLRRAITCWDRYARFWDSTIGADEAAQLLDEELLEHPRLDLMSGNVCLDDEAVSLDISFEMLRGNPSERRIQANVDPWLGAAHLPFRECSFASATIVNSVRYLNRPLETFREVARVIREGGKFYVVNYAGPGTDEVSKPKAAFSPEQLAEMMEQAGFRTLLKEFSFPPSPAAQVIAGLTGVEIDPLRYFSLKGIRKGS